mmetsp:Transcript_36202/g.57920  ORF Transcript_36202/g.57920 Transcript_36202/m.57920 type:complete len:134 (-) Transcript_36202:815-1216(-)
MVDGMGNTNTIRYGDTETRVRNGGRVCTLIPEARPQDIELYVGEPIKDGWFPYIAAIGIKTDRGVHAKKQNDGFMYCGETEYFHKDYFKPKREHIELPLDEYLVGFQGSTGAGDYITSIGPVTAKIIDQEAKL